jgi:hypothetical protein
MEATCCSEISVDFQQTTRRLSRRQNSGLFRLDFFFLARFVFVGKQYCTYSETCFHDKCHAQEFEISMSILLLYKIPVICCIIVSLQVAYTIRRPLH